MDFWNTTYFFFRAFVVLKTSYGAKKNTPEKGVK